MELSMKQGRITAKTVQNDKAAEVCYTEKGAVLAAPEMKTIEIGVVGKFVTVQYSYESFTDVYSVKQR